MHILLWFSFPAHYELNAHTLFELSDTGMGRVILQMIDLGTNTRVILTLQMCLACSLLKENIIYICGLLQYNGFAHLTQSAGMCIYSQANSREITRLVSCCDIKKQWNTLKAVLNTFIRLCPLHLIVFQPHCYFFSMKLSTKTIFYVSSAVTMLIILRILILANPGAHTPMRVSVCQNQVVWTHFEH